MIKIIYFFKRRPGMSVEDFQAHWRTTHADIIVALPGIRRYVQNHVLPSAYRKGEPAFDGVAESWFDDSGALKALAATPQYAAVRADEPQFIDGATMGSIITEEHVLKDGPAPAGGIKTVDFVTHKPGMPLDAFFEYWRKDHGALGAAAPAARRYVQSHTRRSIYAAGRTPAFDGAAMMWFDDMNALRAAAATPEFERLRADVATFVARDKSPSLLTTEQVVLA
ncbi:MAG: EthD family reductase [Burkholderiales bacterium]